MGLPTLPSDRLPLCPKDYQAAAELYKNDDLTGKHVARWLPTKTTPKEKEDYLVQSYEELNKFITQRSYGRYLDVIQQGKIGDDDDPAENVNAAFKALVQEHCEESAAEFVRKSGSYLLHPLLVNDSWKSLVKKDVEERLGCSIQTTQHTNKTSVERAATKKMRDNMMKKYNYYLQKFNLTLYLKEPKNCVHEVEIAPPTSSNRAIAQLRSGKVYLAPSKKKSKQSQVCSQTPGASSDTQSSITSIVRIAKRDGLSMEDFYSLFQKTWEVRLLLYFCVQRSHSYPNIVFHFRWKMRYDLLLFM